MLVSKPAAAATIERWQQPTPEKDLTLRPRRLLAQPDRGGQCRRGGARHRGCLREAIETLGKHAALVTPDRALAPPRGRRARALDVAVDDPAATRSPHAGRLRAAHGRSRASKAWSR
jgi:hypothetical protein